MGNPETSESNGYKPINTNHEDELKLHTEDEKPTCKNENKYLETENVCNRIYSGGCDIQKLWL